MRKSFHHAFFDWVGALSHQVLDVLDPDDLEIELRPERVTHLFAFSREIAFS